mgnify:CR=1 FL=1
MINLIGRIQYRIAQSFRTLYAHSVLLAMLVARPVSHFRLATFRGDRIGHFISETDLAIQLLKMNPSRSTRDVFIFPTEICNAYLKDLYWQELESLPAVAVLDASNSWLARRLLGPARYLKSRVMSSGESHWAYAGSPVNGGIDADPCGLKPSGRPHVRLHPLEKRGALSHALAMGIDMQAPFVCLQVRDSAYLSRMDPSRDWSYHDYRDPDPATYVPTVDYLLAEGFQVIRMGREVNAPFPFEGPGFVDYAVSEARSDFLDVMLFAGSSMVISGSSSGIEQLGTMFNRPLVVTNFIPFTEPRWAVELGTFLPALLRNRVSRTLLPLSAMMRSRFGNSREYQDSGLEIVRNRPDEIVEVVAETLERSRGTWATSIEAESLQASFWAWAEKCEIRRKSLNGPWSASHYRARLGSAFLYKYRDFLLS